MTKISKILAIITVAASVAFLGFVAVTVVGGPNWHAEAHDTSIEAYSHYTYQNSGGENPQWSATKLAINTPQEQPVSGSTSPNLAQTVVAVRQQIKQEQTERIEQLETELDPYDELIAQTRAGQEADLQAIAAREQELVAELNALTEQISDLSDQAIQKSQEAQKSQRITEKRRADVFRMRNQLEEIRTDRFRVAEQIDKLRDQVAQVDANIARLERRRQLLQNGGTDSASQAPATGSGSSGEAAPAVTPDN